MTKEVTYVQVGLIESEKGRLFTTVKPSRHLAIYGLNEWILDYCKDNKLKIEQLPPLDDWSRKGSVWFYSFKDSHINNWLITLEEQVL